MNLTCEHCKSRLNVNDRLAGQIRKCPKCQSPITIPPVAATETPSLPKTLDQAITTNPDVTASASAKLQTESPPLALQATDLPSRRESLQHQIVSQSIRLIRAVFNAEFKSRLLLCWQWLYHQLCRAAHHCGDVVEFYRSRYEAIFIRATLTPLLLEDRREMPREVFLDDSERAGEHWQVELPACCVCCGSKDAGEPQQIVRDVDDLSRTIQILYITPIVALVVWWNYGLWLSLLVIGCGLWLGFLARVRHPISLQIRLCGDHLHNAKFPELFLAAHGLLLRFGHKKVKNRFLRDREPDQSPVLAEPSPPEMEPPPLTIPLADDVESTPIIHFENRQLLRSVQSPIDFLASDIVNHEPEIPSTSSLFALSSSGDGADTPINVVPDLFEPLTADEPPQEIVPSIPLHIVQDETAAEVLAATVAAMIELIQRTASEQAAVFTVPPPSFFESPLEDPDVTAVRAVETSEPIADLEVERSSQDESPQLLPTRSVTIPLLLNEPHEVRERERPLDLLNGGSFWSPHPICLDAELEMERNSSARTIGEKHSIRAYIWSWVKCFVLLFLMLMIALFVDGYLHGTATTTTSAQVAKQLGWRFTPSVNLIPGIAAALANLEAAYLLPANELLAMIAYVIMIAAVISLLSFRLAR